MILGAWAGCFIAALYTGRVLALDTGTVGLFSASLSFVGAIVVAYLNGRGSGRRRVAGAADPLVAALADAQTRLEATERERDRLVGQLEEERRARLTDLRARANELGLTDSPAKRRRRGPAKDG